MTRLEFLVDTRKRLLITTGEIKDAGPLWCNNSDPNWLTKKYVELLFDTVRKNAERFGVFVVERHGDCGRRSHKEDYYYSPIKGRKVAYKEPGFQQTVTLEQKTRDCACPCSASPGTTTHSVLVEILCDKSADSELCEAVSSILDDIYRATELAGTKRPRSGIREHLLRAILTTNDQILPQSVDSYIAQHSGHGVNTK